MTERQESKLVYRVACECGDDHTGEAQSYPEAWRAMNQWKEPHNWMKHPARGKPFDHYSWFEDVKVVGDRSRFDGLQPVSPEERTPSRLFPELNKDRGFE